MSAERKPQRRKRPKTASGRRRAELRKLNRLLELEQSFWERGIELESTLHQSALLAHTLLQGNVAEVDERRDHARLGRIRQREVGLQLDGAIEELRGLAQAIG